MTFLKKWWWLLVLAAIVGLVVWRLWPKTPGVKRKITFFDLPVITGGGDSIASEDERNSVENDHVGDSNLDDLNDLVSKAIADYDNG
jgi:hypothetical protein